MLISYKEFTDLRRGYWISNYTSEILYLNLYNRNDAEFLARNWLQTWPRRPAHCCAASSAWSDRQPFPSQRPCALQSSRLLRTAHAAGQQPKPSVRLRRRRPAQRRDCRNSAVPSTKSWGGCAKTQALDWSTCARWHPGGSRTLQLCDRPQEHGTFQREWPCPANTKKSMRDDRLRRVKVRKKTTDVLQGHGPQRLRAVQENIADLVSKVGALEVLPVLLGHAISERLRRNKGHLLDLLESRCVGLDVLAALRQRIFIIADEDCERLLGHGITGSGLKGSQPFGKISGQERIKVDEQIPAMDAQLLVVAVLDHSRQESLQVLHVRIGDCLPPLGRITEDANERLASATCLGSCSFLQQFTQFLLWAGKDKHLHIRSQQISGLVFIVLDAVKQLFFLDLANAGLHILQECLVSTTADRLAWVISLVLSLFALHLSSGCCRCFCPGFVELVAQEGLELRVALPKLGVHVERIQGRLASNQRGFQVVVESNAKDHVLCLMHERW